MTLEEKYIKKFNFDCKDFSENIKFYIQNDEFLYYIHAIYTSPDNQHDIISLKLFHLDKIHIESKISEFNKDYYLIFPIMISIIHTFTDFLNKNPLILIDYLKKKQIQQFKENKIIKFDAHQLYNLLIDKDTDHSLFLKNMKYNKSYPIKLIDVKQCSNNEFLYISGRNFKIKYKDNLYYFFFTTKKFISLSFEQALTLLSYFSLEDQIGIFKTLGENGSSKDSIDIYLTNYDNGYLISNLEIEKFLLNLEMQNF